MNSLILQHNNLFSKFLIWLKKKFFKKEKYSKEENQNITNINNEIQEIPKKKRRCVYVQDLDYETVKKRTTDLYQKVMNGEVKVEDLELADIIRIQILLDS